MVRTKDTPFRNDEAPKKAVRGPRIPKKAPLAATLHAVRPGRLSKAERLAKMQAALAKARAAVKLHGRPAGDEFSNSLLRELAKQGGVKMFAKGTVSRLRALLHAECNSLMKDAAVYMLAGAGKGKERRVSRRDLLNAVNRRGVFLVGMEEVARPDKPERKPRRAVPALAPAAVA